MVRKNEKGFTLIELLVVIAIIGILAAIAIPQFASYRNNAFCSQVESDVTNAMIAAEAYYAENQAYPGDAATAGFTPTNGVDIAFAGDGVTTPFSVVGTGTAADTCPKGDTFTYTQGSQPAWS
jgi:prepilin-type N-terminal cleavage/methylation domain-containing protein